VAARSPLLYVTHVDWGHIRQRPHHIATGLSAFHEVTVAYPLSRQRARLVANIAAGVARVPLWRLPGSYRSARMLAVNDALCAWQLAGVIRRLRPAVVVVTAPECYAWVRPSLRAAKLAYDCMDDALAFAQDAGVRARKAALERELLARADTVVASTATLASRCVERGAVPTRVTVVRNAWDPAAFPVEPSRALPAAGALTLGYFGTIGDWLDIAALEAIASRCPEALIRLIGPNATGYASAEPRIRVEAPLPHGELAAAVADCDAMLLPFRVDDLTRGVDPVKLYEYIALGRPIACIGYPELERFTAFATLCRDGDELAARIASRDLTPAADFATRTHFLDDNTWDARARELAGALSAASASAPLPAPG
jgi:teichuronic acid biosynthesis glycosyltransferase TuaH